MTEGYLNWEPIYHRLLNEFTVEKRRGPRGHEDVRLRYKAYNITHEEKKRNDSLGSIEDPS